MKFAEKLKAARRKNRLSQSRLAELVGVSVRTIQNYELAGMHPKQREIYYKLAEALGVDVNYLLTEDEELIFESYQKGGTESMRDVEKLISGVCGLFSGGSLPEEDLDAAMKAITEAYFAVKEENRKYAQNKKEAVNK